MALFEINRNPTTRQLRQFAAICLLTLPLVGWLSGGSWGICGVLASIGLALVVMSWVAPQVVKPMFVFAVLLSAPIGLAVGELALLLMYAAVIIPLALVFRLMKRDALQLKMDRDAATYWQPKKPPRDVSSYYRQS